MRKQHIRLDGPLLDSLFVSYEDEIDYAQYPFCVPVIQQLTTLEFPSKVTFFVGENGTGKSTLLEAIAHKAGFGPEGGNKNIAFKTALEKHHSPAQLLADRMIFSWRFKPRNGYFFRAESFYNLANHIDSMALYNAQMYDGYGGKSLHEQSHGESFLSFFHHRLEADGFFILDEPEAALSPQRQLSLLAIIHQVCTTSHAQFIIATHSPLLLAYPGATIYSCDEAALRKLHYTETPHYQITKTFLDNPDSYLRHLFASTQED